MKWRPGRDRQAKEPQQQPAGRDGHLREAFSPWAAGLTDDKAVSWKQFLHEEFGTELDDAGPAVSVPAPRTRPRRQSSGRTRSGLPPVPGLRPLRRRA